MKYNDFLSLMKNRASHRKFSLSDVPMEDIEKIITAASLAPSGHNHQPWKFVVVKNKEVISQMADAEINAVDNVKTNLPLEHAEKLEKYKFFIAHFREAPVVIAVLSRKDSYFTSELETVYNVKLPDTKHFDMELLGVGGAIQSLLLSAVALGYGTCWMTEPVVYAQKDIEKIIKTGDEYNFVSLIALGKPTKERQCAPKKDIKEIMSVIN